MRERSDPLVPILGSAVFVVVVGAIGLVFYPRISRWFGPTESSVTGRGQEPEDAVPIWVCRGVEGVAMVLEERFDDREARALDRGLIGRDHHYLRLTVCNFAREAPFPLTIDKGGLVSPEGGPAVYAAHELVREDAPRHVRFLLRAMGAVESITVPKGARGQILLVTPESTADRGSFALGPLLFERREVVRHTLASWQRAPSWKEFMDF